MKLQANSDHAQAITQAINNRFRNLLRVLEPIRKVQSRGTTLSTTGWVQTPFSRHSLCMTATQEAIYQKYYRKFRGMENLQTKPGQSTLLMGLDQPCSSTMFCSVFIVPIIKKLFFLINQKTTKPPKKSNCDSKTRYEPNRELFKELFKVPFSKWCGQVAKIFFTTRLELSKFLDEKKNGSQIFL